MSTRARKVDWVNEVTDLEVAVMGEMGFSTRYICKETGLTPCQVTYRLQKGGVSRLDVRNGETESARMLRRLATPQIEQRFLKRIK